MRKSVILYAFSLAALVFLLKFLEYQYFVRDLSLEFYLGVVALMFTVLGVWAGFRLTRRKNEPAPVIPGSPAPDEERLKQAGISKREYEVLELMATGCSNQEIARTLGNYLFGPPPG